MALGFFASRFNYAISTSAAFNMPSPGNATSRSLVGRLSNFLGRSLRASRWRAACATETPRSRTDCAAYVMDSRLKV